MYIALDFETTGLDPLKSKILEIGAAKFNDKGEILDTFKILSDPGVKIPKQATALHGITTQMIKGSPTPIEAWELFLAWANDVKIMFAHNAQFEASFIKALYLNRQNIPDIYLADTLRASRVRLKGEKSYKLVDLVGEFDGHVHRALPDATACVSLFIKISKTYKNGKFPIKTYSKPLSEFSLYEEPTSRQLSYIESLGGDISRVKSKNDASAYIDTLKSGTHKRISPPTRIVLLFLLIALVYWIID
ncbi:MAG: 3'-5' exonuclease [Methylophilaceae bacterium]